MHIGAQLGHKYGLSFDLPSLMPSNDHILPIWRRIGPIGSAYDRNISLLGIHGSKVAA